MNKQKLLYFAAGVSCLIFVSVLLHNADAIFGGLSKNDDVEEASITLEENLRQNEGKDFSKNKNSEPQAEQTQSAQNHNGDAVVYVTGAVKRPGVYTVAEGTRIYQLLDLAGGFTEDADKSAVNLATKVSDGAQIDFPSCVETAQKGTKNYNGTRTSKQSSGYIKNSSSSYSRKAKAENTQTGALVDINSASQEELDSLPGVGAKTAELIVNYRREHGRFERIEDLLEIKGIGAKKYEKLKDKITVGN